MERARARWRALSSGPAVAVLLLVLAARPRRRSRHSRTRSAATASIPTCAPDRRGEDIGDVFLLREGDSFQVEIFLEPPNSFIESHVCLSADDFTCRVPPGLCQYQAAGSASGSYDITLPPSRFPLGTTSFTDPLGPFCAQIHVAYNAPGLALTGARRRHRLRRLAARVAVLRQHLPARRARSRAPGRADHHGREDRRPPGRRRDVHRHRREPDQRDRAGRHARRHPAHRADLDPAARLQRRWRTGSSTCDLGDMAGGASVDLFFAATPGPNDCGTFTNSAEGFIGSDTTAFVSRQRRGRGAMPAAAR